MLPILSTKYSHYCFWGSCVTDKSGGWGDAVLPGPYKKRMSEVGRMVTRKSAPSIYKSQHSWLQTTITYIDPLTIWVTRHYTCPRCPKTLHHNYTWCTPCKQTNTHINKEQIEHHKALHSFVKVVSSFMALNIDYDGSEHWLCQILIFPLSSCSFLLMLESVQIITLMKQPIFPWSICSQGSIF